ncbi:MAG: hypothetical protein M3Q14_00295 [bacterium]|nr:hypothetical protein [bacterium]
MDKLPSHQTLAQIVREYSGPPVIEDSPRTAFIMYVVAGTLLLCFALLLRRMMSRRRKRRTYRSRS